MLLRKLTFGEERCPSAGEPGGAVCVVIDLDHVGHGAFEEGPVMAHHQHRCGEAEHPLLEALESIVVEIVGWFVEDYDVESRDQQRSERRAGSLATGQCRSRLVEEPVAEPERPPHLIDTGIKVGSTERQPPVKRVGVAIVGARCAVSQALGGDVEFMLSCRDAGTSRQELPDCLM